MSKKVEEFVKRANEMDELARIKVEAIKGLLTELDDITDKRAEQCKDFFSTCTDEEFNELLLAVDDERKMMYIRMRVTVESLRRKEKEAE